MTYFRTYDADALITYKVSPGTIIYKEPALEEKKPNGVVTRTII